MTNSFSDGVNQFRFIGGPQRYQKTTGAVEAIEVRDGSEATLGHLWTGTDGVSAGFSYDGYDSPAAKRAAIAFAQRLLELKTVGMSPAGAVRTIVDNSEAYTFGDPKDAPSTEALVPLDHD